jgi:hypothetical protein
MDTKIYCNICNKKLKVLDKLTSKCKCDNYFCNKHLFFTDHNCKFDYCSEFKIKSTSNIVKLENKVIKI